MQFTIHNSNFRLKIRLNYFLFLLLETVKTIENQK